MNVNWFVYNFNFQDELNRPFLSDVSFGLFSNHTKSKRSKKEIISIKGHLGSFSIKIKWILLNDMQCVDISINKFKYLIIMINSKYFIFVNNCRCSNHHYVLLFCQSSYIRLIQVGLYPVCHLRSAIHHVLHYKTRKWKFGYIYLNVNRNLQSKLCVGARHTITIVL